MLLTDYKPRPALVTRQTTIAQPKFLVIDAHNHLDADFGDWNSRPVSELLAALDTVNVRLYVDLAGWQGERTVNQRLDYFKTAAPERFCIFAGVDWAAWPERGNRFGEWAAQRLRLQAARGVQGLKIWKPFGLQVRDQNQALVAIDDPRLDPLWATAGELNFPVTIHIADPVAFFDPLDATNERWEELQAHPDWQFPSPPYPAFITLLNAFANLVARHPRTTFIGAHFGCYAENLGWVGALMDRCPNFNVDLSERIGELGRQPYSARRFFLRYADRILFGLDRGVDLATYPIYYRFLETDDEYFSYGPEETPRQGRWRIHGLALPDDVLAKVYHLNAERIILHRKDA